MKVSCREASVRDALLLANNIRIEDKQEIEGCLLYTSPSPRDPE